MVNKFYSLLKLFTGLAIAALIAWKLTVIKATSKAAKPAIKNIHQLILILYAKPCSQLCITHHAIGKATILASITSFIKSLDTSISILDIEAPNTFLTPISFVR